MNNILKEIYLRQKLSFILPKPTKELSTEDSRAMAATVASNFGQLNMIMPTESVELLARCDEKDIESFYSFYMPILEDMIGRDFKNRRLFYPEFPDEVMGKDRTEIFLDQLYYAFTGFAKMPEEKTKLTEFPYFKKGNVKKLNIGSEQGLEDYFKALFNAPTIWTETEKDIIKKVFDHVADYEKFIPNEPLRMKENNIYMLNLIKERLPEHFDYYASKFLKTPTDVLRYAVSFVNGDISLNGKMNIEVEADRWHYNTKILGFSFSKNRKYPDKTRNLTKTEMREILKLFNNTRMDIGKDYPQILEKIKETAKSEGRNDDVILVDDGIISHIQYYKSLAKVMHVNKKAPKTELEKVLAYVCDNGVRSIYSVIEKAISEKDVEQALFYLKYRPTKLMERLDQISRIAIETGKENLVLDVCKEITSKSSVEKLLELYGAFESKKVKQGQRIFVEKGIITTKEGKEALDEKFCDSVKKIVEDALKEKFKNTPYLEDCYIDSSMKEVKTEKANKARDAQNSTFSYTYGSALPNSQETKTKQFAVKWENGIKGEETPYEDIDIDLSATGLLEDGSVTQVSWDSDYYSNGVVYSGDIRTGGSAEFVNVDLKNAKAAGIKMILFNVNIYSGASSFEEMKDCQFVMCERNDMKFGKTYEEKTVMLSIRPECKSKQISPVALDVESGKWIWTDIVYKDKEAGSIASSNLNNITAVLEDVINTNKFAAGYDVLLKAQNCNIVEDMKDAKYIFVQSDKNIDKTALRKDAIIVTQKDKDLLSVFLNDKRTENLPERNDEIEI